MAIAFWCKSVSKHNEFKWKKSENVLKIAKLRFERTNLLGYKTHAHFLFWKKEWQKV